MSGGLHVAAHGPEDGTRVVLVHGTMDRSTSFARVVRQLEDHRVLRYDRRGYGRSVDLGAARDLDQQVDDLLSVVDGQPAVLVGHSLGGTIAAAAAVRAPEVVRSVVAYESPLPWMPWWPADSAGGDASRAGREPADAAEAFMRRMVGDERWERLPPSTRRARRAEGPAMVAELRSIRGPAPFDPADITVPLIAAHGSESAGHHVEAARSLAAAVPVGELVCVDGAAHGVHLTHAEAFADLVRRAGARAAASGR